MPPVFGWTAKSGAALPTTAAAVPLPCTAPVLQGGGGGVL